MESVEPQEEGLELRHTKCFFTEAQYARMDKEIQRRKDAGENVNPVTQKLIFVNRSVVLRDLVDQHLPE